MRTLGFVAAVAATLASSRVRAQAPEHAAVALEYVAPSELGCPDRAAFASSVATRLGYDPFAASPRRGKSLRVEYAGTKRAIRVTMRLSDPGTQTQSDKTLTSEAGGCEELGAAAALSAAT